MLGGQRAARRECQAALHDCRRTAVRNLERAGVPRSTAMRLTGHLTDAIYNRYAIVDSSMLEEGVAKLAAMSANVRSAAEQNSPSRDKVTALSVNRA